MNVPLKLWGHRLTSWFRSVVMPRRTEASEINEAAERPWLEENMGVYAGNLVRRFTSLSDNQTGETIEMRKAYRAAMVEPTVKAALLGKIGSVSFLDVQCVPEDKKNPLEIEAAAFVKYNMIGPSGTFYDLAWPILSGGLIDGFSVCEKQFGIIPRGRFANKWGLRGVKSRDTNYLQLEIDRYRNITGIYSTWANSGTFFDPNDFVVFSYLSLFENPCGMSDLRAAYRAVTMILAAMKLRMIFLDKYTGPYLKGRYTDASRRTALRESLKTARGNGWIMLGPGDDVDVVDLASHGTSDFQAAIDDLRKEVAISVQGSFLTMLEGSAPGVRGNSQVQKETSEVFVELLVANICSTINTQIVPDLIIPNYGTQIAFPRFGLSAVDSALIAAELDIDAKLQGMGLDLSREEVYDRAGRAPPKDPADILKPPSAQPPGGGMPGGGGLPFPAPGGSPAQFSESEESDWTEQEDPATFAAEDWSHAPGPRSKRRWVNKKTGQVAYSDTNPGDRGDSRHAAGHTVDAVHEKIKNTLGKKDLSPDDVQALARHIHDLDSSQIHELKRRLGLSASGPKAELAQKIAQRAIHGMPVKLTVPANPKRGNVYSVSPKEIVADPDRFQFKLGTSGPSGVGDELRGVDKWNPDLGGVVSVWKDPADGKTYVVNGHHRLELAKRTGAGKISVRYLDAGTATEARGKGALINIAEGRGTAVDAAKFMRDTKTTPADFEKTGISLKGKVASDAATLTQLSDPLFSRVARGSLDTDRALAIAANCPDHAAQTALLDHIEKQEDRTGREYSPKVVAEAAKEASITATTTEKTKTLFGDEENEKSLVMPRAELKAHIRAELSKEVRDYQAVASQRRADRVAGEGNVFNVAANKAAADKAENLADTFNRLSAYKGELSDILNEEATNYDSAKTNKEREAIRKRALDRTREALPRIDAEAVRGVGSGSQGTPGASAGHEGQVDDSAGGAA